MFNSTKEAKQIFEKCKNVHTNEFAFSNRGRIDRIKRRAYILERAEKCGKKAENAAKKRKLGDIEISEERKRAQDEFMDKYMPPLNPVDKLIEEIDEATTHAAYNCDMRRCAGPPPSEDSLFSPYRDPMHHHTPKFFYTDGTVEFDYGDEQAPLRYLLESEHKYNIEVRHPCVVVFKMHQIRSAFESYEAARYYFFKVCDSIDAVVESMERDKSDLYEQRMRERERFSNEVREHDQKARDFADTIEKHARYKKPDLSKEQADKIAANAVRVYKSEHPVVPRDLTPPWAPISQLTDAELQRRDAA